MLFLKEEQKTKVSVSYFVKNHLKSNNKYKQDEIIEMLDVLIDNIFVLFGGRVFQQTFVLPKVFFLEYSCNRKTQPTIN